ncbi:MAG TPA: M28 family peptidase [Solirubrobacteraceae bacterium]
MSAELPADAPELSVSAGGLAADAAHDALGSQARVAGAGVRRAALEPLLREVVEALAPLERTACSAGERQAAEWLAARFASVEGVEAALEDEPSWGTFPPTATGLGLASIVAAGLVLARRRARGALLAMVTFLGMVDEAHNGPRILRRLVRRRKLTVNVVARMGDPNAPYTLVALAHHDAPQTGALFDQSLQRKLHERAPELLARFKTPLPQWWVGLAGPLLTLVAAFTGRLRLARAGLALGTLGTAAVADIWRSETVPGANDNLSGVAALVGLAELLRERPAEDLRVLLVSCGAEETLQDGIRAFVARHRHELDPARTAFVNFETVGSPHLILLEAEGPVRMESYTGPWLTDLLELHGERLGTPLLRGFRARASTDSVIPSRAGYPIATIVSITDWFSPANYHLPSDVPANLDYGTVAAATRLVHEIADLLPAALAAAR